MQALWGLCGCLCRRTELSEPDGHVFFPSDRARRTSFQSLSLDRGVSFNFNSLEDRAGAEASESGVEFSNDLRIGCSVKAFVARVGARDGEVWSSSSETVELRRTGFEDERRGATARGKPGGVILEVLIALALLLYSS